MVLFNRLAEVASEYLKKGAKIYIEGHLRTRKWQDKEGQDRYTTEIVGNDMQMLDSRGANYSTQTDINEQEDSPTRQPSSAEKPSRPADNFDDDIPF